MPPLGEIFGDLLLGIVSTIIGVLVIYWIFLPHIRLGYRVQDVGTDSRIHCSYRNSGWLGVHDVRVRVWVSVELVPGRRIFVDIPLDDAERPMLENRLKSTWQKPRLLLDEADWSQMPSLPNDPFTLRKILSDNRAELVLAVSTTTNIAQITRVKRRSYQQSDVS